MSRKALERREGHGLRAVTRLCRPRAGAACTRRVQLDAWARVHRIRRQLWGNGPTTGLVLEAKRRAASATSAAGAHAAGFAGHRAQPAGID
jgi:hypothetical protein